MTKQEKMRERAIIDLMNYKGFDRLPTEYIVDHLFAFLHSQGVVIRVDRELPNKKCLPIFDKPTRTIIITVPQWWDKEALISYFGTVNQEQMLKAGYVAVEPLIKGGDK